MTTTQFIDLPTTSQSPNIRITQLDVLRGFAVLGIYWINVIIFGLPMGAYSLPNLLGESETLNIGHWVFSELFVEGSMRGLFSMLFGASAMVFLDESRLGANGLMVVDRFYRRNLILILFGIAHAYLLLWPFDVLYAYGLIGLFLFPLRKVNPYALIVAGSLLLVIGDIDIIEPITRDNATTQSSSLDASADSKTNESAFSRNDTNYRESMRTQMEENVAVHQSGYITIFKKHLEEVVSQESVYMYSVHFFDIGGMMLWGMALLKLGVLSGKRSRRFYLLLATGGYTLSILIRSFSVFSELTHGFVPDDIAEHGGVNYAIGRLPLTLAHIGLLALFCMYPVFDRFTNTLAKVGRLALTHYIMQTVLSIWLFYGVGWGLIGVFERYQLVYFCVAVWLVQILFSIAWLKRFQFGPLEWIWRSLIYAKRQPLRKPR